jgi:hypothetical protein
MTAQVSQSVVVAGTTPAALTPGATDTIASQQFGPTGLYARVITTGTSTNVSVLDPGLTPQGNPGTVTAVAAPATGVRMVFIPRSAINPATDQASVTFSGALTGVTYELYRV